MVTHAVGANIRVTLKDDTFKFNNKIPTQDEGVASDVANFLIVWRDNRLKERQAQNSMLMNKYYRYVYINIVPLK